MFARNTVITLSRELTTLVEMKLKAKHPSEFEVIENKYNNTSNQLDNISKEIQEFEELEQENIKIRERLDKIKDFIDSSTQKVPELDSNVFQNAIFKIVQVDKTNCIFVIKNNKDLDELTFIAFRNELLDIKPVDLGIIEDLRNKCLIHYKVVQL